MTSRGTPPTPPNGQQKTFKIKKNKIQASTWNSTTIKRFDRTRANRPDHRFLVFHSSMIDKNQSPTSERKVGGELCYGTGDLSPTFDIFTLEHEFCFTMYNFGFLRINGQFGEWI